MTKPIATIMMGLPCSGKTTWIKENCDGDIPAISADNIKEEHPAYDPTDNGCIHEWSIEQAENRVYSHIRNGGGSFIFDSGSINNSYTKRIIGVLRDHQYYIRLVHVKTPYQVCLDRNSKRARKVPADSITHKAVIENRQFHRIKDLCHEVIVVDYFSNKHVFVDMDGVIAAQTTLPIINGEIDFVNAEIHKWQLPVEPVIEKLFKIKARKYILSAAVNSIAMEEKEGWLNEHAPLLWSGVYFVNQGKHKAEMLENICRKLKLDKRDVLLIDDTHATLYDVKARGMNAMHPSEFLTTTF